MATDTNVGKWDRWYAGLDEEQPYGLTETYQLGADFLRGCALIEDWGCGKGWMRRYVPAERYRGIDGSRTPFADEIVDLATYRSDVPGVFMRHVLEHDYRWQAILDNAVASFRQRMVLVLFTPLVHETHELTFAPDPGVPDLAFKLADLTDRFGGARWRHETLQTATQYGVETVFYLDRTGG